MIEGSRSGDDETAYPVEVGQTCDTLRGMSLLDWFAGQALAGICANSELANIASRSTAEWVYDLAESMMAEREKRAKRSE